MTMTMMMTNELKCTELGLYRVRYMTCVTCCTQWGV